MGLAAEASQLSSCWIHINDTATTTKPPLLQSLLTQTIQARKLQIQSLLLYCKDGHHTSWKHNMQPWRQQRPTPISFLHQKNLHIVSHFGASFSSHCWSMCSGFGLSSCRSRQCEFTRDEAYGDQSTGQGEASLHGRSAETAIFCTSKSETDNNVVQ